jgi:hypothetical protein
MKKTITLVIIIHSDLNGYTKETLYTDYFAWLKPNSSLSLDVK